MLQRRLIKWKSVSRLLYIIGIAFLLNGFLLSAINIPVNATQGGNTPTPDNKVRVCHWTEANKYVSIEVSVNSIDSIGDWGLNGHGNHSNDVYPSFTAKNGDVITAAGDQSLLASDCKIPTATKTATSTKTATVTKTATMTKTPTKTTTSTPVNTNTQTKTNTPSNTFTVTATEDNSKKVNVCHWTEAEKYVSIEVSINSVASQADWGLNGHGGHENDIWPQFIAKNGDIIAAYGDQSILKNECEDHETTATPTATVTKSSTPTDTATSTETVTPTDIATVIATETTTATETATATYTPTSTGTVTEIDTPTSTFTTTPTDVVEKLRLSGGYACFVQYIEWSITNPNSYPVTVTWELDPVVVNAVGGVSGKFFAPRALAFIAALPTGVIVIGSGETVIVASTTPATHVLKFSYALQQGDELTVEQLTNGSNFCVINETPEDSATVTPVPTLPKPSVQSGQDLIPVTGIDLTSRSQNRSNMLGQWLSMVGLLSIGLGMVIQGFTKK